MLTGDWRKKNKQIPRHSTNAHKFFFFSDRLDAWQGVQVIRVKRPADLEVRISFCPIAVWSFPKYKYVLCRKQTRTSLYNAIHSDVECSIQFVFSKQILNIISITFFVLLIIYEPSCNLTPNAFFFLLDIIEAINTNEFEEREEDAESFLV